MQNRFRSFLLWLLTASIFLGLGGWVGFKAGENHPQRILIEGVSDIQNPGEITADFGSFWQAWQKVEELYLRSEKVTEADKVQGAIRGLIGSLEDPYSEYFPPEEAEKFEEDVQGNFGGIGAELGIRKGFLVIVAPLKSTPAERAGLQPNDQILAVNSSSTLDMPLDQAVRWIRGKVGTTVKLLMLRESWAEPREISITRDIIQIPTLDFSMKEDVAYVQLYHFNANAEPLFAEAARQALREQARGMVLDLRNNPGGFLQVAVDLAGWFVPQGTVVVSEEKKTGSREEFRTYGNEALEDMPIVILVNEGSASAAEILAGALRDVRGVKLVGARTFGKGTVQQLVPLRDDSSLKLTIAHWVMPGGKILEEGGLEPDVEVEISETDREEERDPQLERALAEIPKD